MHKLVQFRKRPDPKKSILGADLLFLKKAFNFALSEFQYRLRQSTLLAYPIFLTADPSGICQLHCPLCPTGEHIDGRKAGKMDVKTFERLMEEIGDYLMWVDFTNWGEPLLNDDVYQMITFAKKKRTYTSLSTNLNYLPNPDLLVSSGLDVLWLSIDGGSEGTYLKYRRGGEWGKVMENLKRLIESRQKQKKSTPYIVWRFLVFKHNIHEIQIAQELAKETGVDAIEFSGGHVFMGMMPFTDINQLIRQSSDYLVANKSEFSLFNEHNKLKHPADHCSWLWKSITVNWDGSVSPCCGVWPQKYDFANFPEFSIKHIWNSPAYKRARQAVREVSSGRLKAGTESNNVCEICSAKRNYVEGLDLSRQPSVLIKEF